MYVKLFSDILQSSIWAEDAETKVVWITMLALADQDGLVCATAPGIAHEARVDLEKTKAVLELLQSPDPESRTSDNEGRRIERVDGGFFILNYEKYRNLSTAEKRREQGRLRVRRYRERHRNVTQCNACNACNAMLRQAEANADAEAEADPPTPLKPPRPGTLASFEKAVGEFASVEEICGRAVKVCGALAANGWHDWFLHALAGLESTGGDVLEFERAVQYCEDCADPNVRRSKDLGELSNPLGYLIKKLTGLCANVGWKNWKRFPKSQDKKAAANG